LNRDLEALRQGTVVCFLAVHLRLAPHHHKDVDTIWSFPGTVDL